MIDMTNLEFAIANYYVRPYILVLGNGNWKTEYGTSIEKTYNTREEAIEKTVVLLREKHKSNGV